ncbi:hypothetical protein Ritam007_70 [Mycobacterium phage Ritam007]|nr:hypothetical protein Saroj_70 [Mycobacterium phage Saroj]UZV39596.1 hypothetical protein Ritam007_70 [Mycobacterium phage Ritam007]
MTALNYHDIAASVLKLAASIDHRMEPSSQEMHDNRKNAWAALFTGQVWPAEAEGAVIDHYRDPRAFPLMPGDVIAYCKSQPVWSSVEHARDWVMRTAVQMPYSGAIEAYSGVTEPIIDIPAEIGRESHKAYLIQKLTEWVAPRLDELAAAIVAKRFTPWWNEAPK